MKKFIAVHDKSWNERLTLIRKKAISSIAETVNHRAIIVYGNDIVVETCETFNDVIRLVDREV